MTEVILPLLASITIAFLAWGKLHKLRRWMIIVLLLFGLGSIWLEQYQNKIRGLEAESKAENLDNQLQKTREQLTTLERSSDSTLTSLDSLLKLYAPLVNKAREQFPDLNDADAIKTLLTRIDKSITSTKPKLVHVKGKDKTGIVRVSGFAYHRFVFESKPPGILRNQKLFLQFDKKIDSANLRIFETIVQEQGKRISVGSDSMSVSCFVDLLRADNSLYIEVTSTNEISLKSLRINE